MKPSAKKFYKAAEKLRKRKLANNHADPGRQKILDWHHVIQLLEKCDDANVDDFLNRDFRKFQNGENSRFDYLHFPKRKSNQGVRPDRSSSVRYDCRHMFVAIRGSEDPPSVESRADMRIRSRPL